MPQLPHPPPMGLSRHALETAVWHAASLFALRSAPIEAAIQTADEAVGALRARAREAAKTTPGFSPNADVLAIIAWPLGFPIDSEHAAFSLWAFAFLRALTQGPIHYATRRASTLERAFRDRHVPTPGAPSDGSWRPMEEEDLIFEITSIASDNDLPR